MTESLYVRVGSIAAVAPSVAQALVRQGRVTVDGVVCTAPEMGVDRRDKIAVTMLPKSAYSTSGRFRQPGYTNGFADALIMDAAVDIISSVVEGAFEVAASVGSGAIETFVAGLGDFGGGGSSGDW